MSGSEDTDQTSPKNRAQGLTRRAFMHACRASPARSARRALHRQYGGGSPVASLCGSRQIRPRRREARPQSYLPLSRGLAFQPVARGAPSLIGDGRRAGKPAACVGLPPRGVRGVGGVGGGSVGWTLVACKVTHLGKREAL